MKNQKGEVLIGILIVGIIWGVAGTTIFLGKKHKAESSRVVEKAPAPING